MIKQTIFQKMNFFQQQIIERNTKYMYSLVTCTNVQNYETLPEKHTYMYKNCKIEYLSLLRFCNNTLVKSLLF